MKFEHGASYSFMPVSCLHYPYGDLDLIKGWVKKVASDPHAFTILLGDQFDLARKHYRDHLRAYLDDGNSQAAVDDLVRSQVRELAKLLDPIQDKIVGVLKGNHTYQFLDQTLSDQYLCQLMKLPYLGVFSLFRVEFRDAAKSDHARYAMPILAHHTGGCKGSRTQGGDVTALKRFEDGFEAQIYVAGHTHRKYSFKSPKLTIPAKGEPIPREYTKVFIRAGAFLKGYQADYPSATTLHTPSYAEEAAYPPVDLGHVTCTWQFKQASRPGDSRSNTGYYPQFELRF